MTEANLRPSWPSYQSHMHSMLLYCLHKSGEVCTYFHILLCLVQFTSVTVQRGIYTIWWKASCTLTP